MNKDSFRRSSSRTQTCLMIPGIQPTSNLRDNSSNFKVNILLQKTRIIILLKTQDTSKIIKL